MRQLLRRLEERRRSIKKASVDAIISFKHKGKTVTAKMKHSVWKGGDKMEYTWLTLTGEEVKTVGIPKGAKVVSDVPGPVK